MSEKDKKTFPQKKKEKKNIRELSTLLSDGINIYRENWLSFAKILLIFILGTLPIWIVAGARITASAHFNFSETGLNYFNVFFVFLAFLAGIFAIYVNVSAKATLFTFFKKIKEKKKESIKDLFNDCRKKYFWPLLLVNVLVFIFVFLWTLLLIIPGIIFGIYYSFAGWVLIFEDCKGREALKRSKELVKGNWWNVFVRYLFLYLALFFFLVVLDIILSPLGGETAERVGDVAEQIVSFLLMPFFFAYSYLIYKDLLKIRGSRSK